MGCNDCNGSVAELSKTLQEACGFLVKGHAGVREIYRVLASQAKTPEDKALFEEGVAKHDRLARETAEVVVPTEGG